MTSVFAALGSNIDPEKNIPLALNKLHQLFPDLKISPIYRCEPVGFSGGYFWNLVVHFSTDKLLEELAECLRQLEFTLGREADAKKNSARTVDIDILLYGNCVGDYGRIHLPRNDIVKYAFVLKPLAELAPEVIHPVNKLSLDALYRQSELDFSELQRVEYALLA